jgi:hypothetical protein
LLEIYNIIVFQFPHSTLKKYLRHFFYINMNMQVMRHKSHLMEVKMGLFVYLARIARLLRQFKVELLLQLTLTHQHSAVLLYDN